MPVSRYRRRFTGTTSNVGDTGPSMFGALWQVHWVPITADTGMNIRIDMLQQGRAANNLQPLLEDTGIGMTVFTSVDVGISTGNLFAPRQRMNDQAGVQDTGLTPIVWAGERPRFKIIPSQSAFDGWLTAWWVD